MVTTARDRLRAFETLGIPRGAPKETILKAWRRKMRGAHPDKPGGCEALAKSLNQARDDAMGSIGYVQSGDAGTASGWTRGFDDARMARLRQLYVIMEKDGRQTFEEFRDSIDSLMGSVGYFAGDC